MASFFGKLRSSAVSISCSLLYPSSIRNKRPEETPNGKGYRLLISGDAKGPTSPTSASSPAKKDPNAPQPTPLEKLLSDAGPIRDDGSDKFFGLENVGRNPTFSEYC